MKLLSFTLLASSALIALPVQADELKKYAPKVEIGGKLGNERHVGTTKFMIPIYQNDDSMLFTDVRGRIDDNSSEEFNIGLGYRKITSIQDTPVIIGGYAFYDQLYSPTNNTYSQVTLGLEAMTAEDELRINYYIPENEENIIGAGGLVINGGSIGINNNFERALGGFDAEIGHKLPTKGYDFRLYAGGYYFDESGYDTVAGPSARLELTLDETNIAILPSGSELRFGLEAQYDDVRDEQFYALAEFSIPLGYEGYQERSNLPEIDKRMTKFVERDIDIITSNPRTKTESVSVNGISINNYVTLDSGDNVITGVTTAGQNSLVVIDGTGGQVNAGNVINMENNQVLVGGGTDLTFVGAQTGRSVDATMGGARPTIASGGGGFTGIATSSNSMVKNIDYTNVQTIIAVNNDANVRLEDISNSAGSPATGVSISGTNGIIEINNLNFNNGPAYSIDITGTTTNLSINNSSFTSGDAMGGGVLINNVGSTITNLSGSNNAFNGIGGDPECTNSGTITSSTLRYTEGAVKGSATACP